MDRRDFIKTTGCFSVAVFLGPACATWPRHRGSAREFVPDAFIRVFPDGRVVYVLCRAEMGQGVYTSEATLVAEELGLEPDALEVELSPVDPAYNNPAMGTQTTGGSTSTRAHFAPLRAAGARAHRALRHAAAELLQVRPVEVAQDQKFFFAAHDPGRRVHFGQLVERAPAHLDDGEPRSRETWRSLGQPLRRLDGPAKVFAPTCFGLDVALPGLRHACLWRHGDAEERRALAARLEAAASPALQVLLLPAAIAVIGPDSHGPLALLRRARDEGWSSPLRGRGTWDSDALQRQFGAALDAGAAVRARDDGDVDAVTAEWTFRQRLAFPYLPHQPMEPLNATARVHRQQGRPVRAELWLGTQAPDLVRAAVARALHLDAEAVEVHQTLLGGGFGRRGDFDMAVEVAELAAHLDGPVQLTWSREDDTWFGTFRPGSEHLVEVKVAGGGIAAWRHRVATPALLGAVIPGYVEALNPLAGKAAGLLTDVALGGLVADPIAVECAAELPYAIPNLRVEHAAVDPGVPLTFWRSNGASFNTFVVETALDEAIRHLGQDPLDFRMALLGAHPRHQGVLEALRQASGWGTPLPPGVGRGLALQESYGSVVGEVAEVRVVEGRPRVQRVFVAVDCGTAVNPDLVAQQMESGVIFGLSAALHGRVDWRHGLPVQSNFHDLRLVRMAEAPDVETTVLPSQAPPTGVGEPGVPPIAPAVANALRQLGHGPFVGLPLVLDAR